MYSLWPKQFLWIKTEEGYICYNCYSDKKNLSKTKATINDNEEAGIQSEFFNKAFILPEPTGSTFCSPERWQPA